MSRLLVQKRSLWVVLHRKIPGVSRRCCVRLSASKVVINEFWSREGSSNGFSDQASPTPAASFSRAYLSSQTSNNGGAPLDPFHNVARDWVGEPTSVNTISPECSQSPKSNSLSGLYSIGSTPEHAPSPRSLEFPSPDTPGHTRNVVTNSMDARVFGVYINHIGHWVRTPHVVQNRSVSLNPIFQLDIASPNRYFSEAIPRLALSNKALYYACLTCASRLLTRRGELPKAQGDIYEDTAISTLIPQLSNASTCGDMERETLIATVVILRMAEQFSEVQDDARCHLVDASSLLISKTISDENQSLGAAAFWLYMRQSIRAAFLNEEPCKFDMALVANDVGTAPAADAVWINRVTTLLARVCSACWDTELDPVLRHRLLVNLGELLEEWRQNVPDTFQPWCEYQAENEPFRTIRYISPLHGLYYPSSSTTCIVRRYRSASDLTSGLSRRVAILLHRKNPSRLIQEARRHEYH